MSDADFQTQMKKGIEEINSSLSAALQQQKEVLEMLGDFRRALRSIVWNINRIDGNIVVLQQKAGLHDN